MYMLALWPWVVPFLNIVLFITGWILIGLVLIQRGKGGGLAGAFGGAGGSSAFGSRAGDTFTKVTIVTAFLWLVLIMAMIKMVQPAPQVQTPVPDITTPADQSPAEKPS